MIEVIGEATGHERFRTDSNSSLAGKDVIVQEPEPMRKTQLVEMLKAGESANSDSGEDEPTRNRTKLDDGKIIGNVQKLWHGLKSAPDRALL